MVLIVKIFIPRQTSHRETISDVEQSLDVILEAVLDQLQTAKRAVSEIAGHKLVNAPSFLYFEL